MKHRRRLGALGVAALAGTLMLAGCAKDVNGPGSGASSGGGSGTGQGCKLAAQPPAAPAAATSSQEQGKGVDGSKMRVGLAYDIGGRGDASFNDAAYRGLEEARAKLGVKDSREVSAQPNETEDQRQSRLRQLADDGFNPIITVGYSYAESLKAVAKQRPKTQFAIVDDDTIKLPNVHPLVFASEQGSFLIGVAAAYKSKNCHIGFVGGVRTPLIQAFEAGYLQGAKAAAPGIKIEDDYLKPAGDNSGFNDPSTASLKASGQLQKGADVIYHAAGASGKGVFDAVKQAGGGALGIGVDSDQYFQPTVANDKDIIMTSMVKKVDQAVFGYLAAFASNKLGGYPKRFDLSTGAVGYTRSGGKINDITGPLDAYKQQIIDGKIQVKDKP
ncbi:BMP family lipoprotein [Sciscionella marina]|uniref:BMP family lipoprotein n=1 Tax=Sciscionella marina TaxID=508770 RepID=UPI000477300F|nr:BMP family ABC transporter substrate-binding protein [Sciscionella marina]